MGHKRESVAENTWIGGLGDFVWYLLHPTK